MSDAEKRRFSRRRSAILLGLGAALLATAGGCAQTPGDADLGLGPSGDAYGATGATGATGGEDRAVVVRNGRVVQGDAADLAEIEARVAARLRARAGD